MSEENNIKDLEYTEIFKSNKITVEDIENNSIFDNSDRVVGLSLLYKLSQALKTEIFDVKNSISDTFKKFKKVLKDNNLIKDQFNQDMDFLTGKIEIVNKFFNNFFPDKILKFRGISTTDPKTGIVTLDGIKYDLRKFTKENNGDIFYYRDISKKVLNQNDDNNSYIYSYIYLNGSLKEDIFRYEYDKEYETSKEFNTYGYRFFNNLSSIIVDKFVADDADIKISKIQNLPNYLSSFENDISVIGSQSDNINNILSTIYQDCVENLSNEISNIVNSYQISNDNNKNENLIVIQNEITNLQKYLRDNLLLKELIKTNYTDYYSYLVPSLLSLSSFLSVYSLTGHTHETTDIGNLPEQIDSIVSSKIPFANIDYSFETMDNELSQRVPSTSLLKNELDKLEKRINDLIQALNSRIDSIIQRLIFLTNHVKDLFKNPEAPKISVDTTDIGLNFIIYWNKIDDVDDYVLLKGSSENNLSSFLSVNISDPNNLPANVYLENKDNNIYRYIDNNILYSLTRYYQMYSYLNLQDLTLSSDYSNIDYATTRAYVPPPAPEPETQPETPSEPSTPTQDSVTRTFDPKTVYILQYSDDSDVTIVKVGNMAYNVSNTRNNGKCVGLFYYSGATKTISPRPENVLRIPGKAETGIFVNGSNETTGPYQSNNAGLYPNIFYIESSYNIIEYRKVKPDHTVGDPHPKSVWDNKWINFSSSAGVVGVDSTEGLSYGTEGMKTHCILPGYSCKFGGYGSVWAYN